jgi:integrase
LEGRSRKSPWFGSKGEAKRWRHEKQLAADRGVLEKARTPTIEALADEIFENAEAGILTSRSRRPFKPSTIRSYRICFDRYLRREFGGFRIADLRRGDVNSFIVSISTDKSPSTIRNILMPLRLIVRYSLDMEHINVDPLTGLRLPAPDERPREVIALEDTKALIDVLPNAQDKAIYGMAAFAGLRRSEIRALRQKHIDLEDGIIRVEASWDRVAGEVPPKSAAGNRIVPIPNELKDLLLPLELDQPEAFLFPSRTGNPFCPQTLYRRVSREIKGTNLKPVGLQVCRHAFASFAIKAGINMKLISTYMGHSSIRITIDRYGHLLPGDEEEYAELMNQFLASKPASNAAIAA